MKKIIIYILLLTCFSFAEKSSSDIQNDINQRNVELKTLRKEIEKVQKRISSKTDMAISYTEKLLDIEEKINLSEKLVRSLNREERFLSEYIYEISVDIEVKQQKLDRMKIKRRNRVQSVYLKGRPSLIETIFLSKSWSDFIYRVKYIKSVSLYEKELAIEINKIISELELEKKKKESTKRRKQNLRIEKEIENKGLTKDKSTRKKYLSKINKEKYQLEKQLADKHKIEMELQNLIGKLIANKDEMKLKEDALAKRRAELQKATTGNFAAQKGKLPWPIIGNVIAKFGAHRNKQTNTITENTGIEIQAPTGTPILSVLDGLVSTVTYLRGYGNVVIITHGGGYLSVYGRVDNITVHENEYVQQGLKVAEVSGLGYNGKPALHFEVWGNRKKLDPEKWLRK
jgi:murein hydrolase activator